MRLSRPLPSLELHWAEMVEGRTTWHFLNSLDPAPASWLFLKT
jgi:hypothetical protein